jgi:hypothetical protein
MRPDPVKEAAFKIPEIIPSLHKSSSIYSLPLPRLMICLLGLMTSETDVAQTLLEPLSERCTLAYTLLYSFVR